MRTTGVFFMFGLMGAAVRAAPYNYTLPRGNAEGFREATASSRPVLNGENGTVENTKSFTSIGSRTAIEKQARGFGAVPFSGGSASLPGDIQITIINATPYPWKRGYRHSYQLLGWQKGNLWPEVIEPGVSHRYRVKNDHQVWTNADDAGEVVYALQGTKKPMSFQIQYEMTSLNTYEVHVQFLEDLQTKTTAKDGRILIGDRRTAGFAPDSIGAGRGGCSFHIAGKEGDFMSTTDWWKPNEGGWMQDLLPTIGDYPLKDIVMPRSHHAALDTTKDGHKLTGASVYSGQAVTQWTPIRAQLSKEGVRILDERVHYSKERGFTHAHVSTNIKSGAIGRRLIEVIDAINDYNDANPGELIIWDIHSRTIVLDDDYKPFGPKLRKNFYNFLKTNLKHLARLPKRQDYSDLTLNDLVGNGKSAVILRFNNWSGVPGPEEGFVTTENFPVHDHWSEKYSPEDVFNDQLLHLQQNAIRGGKAHGMQFLRSLGGGDMALPDKLGLCEMARELMTWFRYQLWNSLSDQKYPNWISFDGFEGGEVKGFVIAMNKCFVARQCGDWVKRNAIQ